MSGSITPCIACGKTGGKMTNEDAYPKWLHKALNIRGPLTLSAGGKPVRQMKTLEAKVKLVCADCNHGWMHELEEAFRERMYWALTGIGTVDLDATGQHAVAMWALKTWLMLGESLRYLHQPGFAFEVPPFMHWMFEHHELPPTVQVFLGGVDALRENAVGFLSTQLVVIPPDPPRGVTGVFTIGCLIFQVYVPVTQPGQGYHELGLDDYAQQFLRPIWPITEEVVRWPPRRIFANSDLEKLWPSGGFFQPSPEPPA